MTGRKRCNRLDGKTWTRYSISLWGDIRRGPAEGGLNHPAGFPLQLARRCIEIFTSGPGELVLDPFAGSGTTLIAAAALGRRGVGVELYSHYVELYERRFREEGKGADGEGGKPQMILGDARNLRDYFKPGEVDFVLTSPPYWDVMQSARSADFKEPRPYGESERDLGRRGSYEEYLRELGRIYEQVAEVLKPGRYLVTVVMDLRKKNRFYPLHFDITRCLEQAGLYLDDIIIWDRRHEYNRLRPLGYPAVFRVNKVHEYLLIFRK